ncbi:hypothetical protein RRG08_015655, partial [Elysia crispata]
MTLDVFEAQEKSIDEAENEFCENVKKFTSDTKVKMRTSSREDAMKVFDFAFVFLTQAIPDLSNLEYASEFRNEETATLRKDFEKFENNMKSLSQKLEEAQLSIKSLSEKLEDAQQNLSEKVSKVVGNASFFQEKVEKNLDELNEAKRSNTLKILGLRMMQKVLYDRTKLFEDKAETTTSSSQASASVAATSYVSTQRLSQRSTTFSVRALGDAEVPNINDMKLLPGCLIVLADSKNKYVKLYDRQGRQIHNRAFKSSPVCLTIMDITCPTTWEVGVTQPLEREISILTVTQNSVQLKASIKTERQYWAIAAVTTKTLAVSDLYGAGVDLIDLSGMLLYKLSTTFNPWHLVTSPDECLVMSHYPDDSLAKMKLEDNTTIFHHKVPQ